MKETQYRFGCGPRCHHDWWRCPACAYFGISAEDARIRGNAGD